MSKFGKIIEFAWLEKCACSSRKWHLHTFRVSFWMRFEENHYKTIRHVQKVREQELVRTSWHMNPHRRRRHEMLCAHETLRTQWFRRKPAPFGMRFHDKLRESNVKQSIFQTVKTSPGKDFEEQESAPMIAKTRNRVLRVLWVFCGNIVCL